MDIVATSLEALIQRATSPSNPGTDTAAIDAFCGMVNKEPNSAHIATKLITTRIQSPQEWEALQSLNVLEACMKRCGSSFHTEIGKFRFLNEMIKLVSPKYLGSQTPKPVRDRVLQLMYSWTVDYPRETKIKEAYQMLRKQGVVTDDPPVDGGACSSTQSGPVSNKSSVFEDEKKQRLLQKLLQSKNPEDLQAANRLIKTMVKEDERRTEMICRRATELEAAHNNARLLSEMLDCYRPASSSKEDLDLIKELHQSCERFSMQISRDLKPEESLFGDVMETMDELKQVFARYEYVIVESRPAQQPQTTVKAPTGGTSLLDLSTPSGDGLVTTATEQLAGLGLSIAPPTNSSGLGGLGLGDLLELSTEDSRKPTLAPSASALLQPVSLNPAAGWNVTALVNNGSVKSVEDKPGAVKAFEELDALGETLLKQSLPSNVRAGPQFNKPPVKVPMNLLGRSSSTTSDNGSLVGGEASSAPLGGPTDNSQTSSFDLDFLIGNHSANATVQKERNSCLLSADELLNGDEAMVDLSDDRVSLASKPLPTQDKSTTVAPQERSPITDDAPKGQAVVSTDRDGVSANQLTDLKPVEVPKVTEVKPLNEISISLESIKPGEW
ncbi:hypothetical protein ONE63_005676 [Megalurothrips usitatus]|uniref:ADP-ribosylation factor-binding protein GGA1 n=1 Tax=Megalurothrips usitatus TaxID=439358 RepID=A0AAV7XXB3_9NEOP|nr:hypothetical protein ONE63_005676 [Megalurothrips usitatus]